VLVAVVVGSPAPGAAHSHGRQSQKIRQTEAGVYERG
jgi:hypothetical protein